MTIIRAKRKLDLGEIKTFKGKYQIIKEEES
jgi:hypothetical protein